VACESFVDGAAGNACAAVTAMSDTTAADTSDFIIGRFPFGSATQLNFALGTKGWRR
jgi:hypothetical protein